MLDKKQNLSEYNPSQIPDVTGKKIAIITSQWNFPLTSVMQQACVDTLLQHGFVKKDIIQCYVAGSYELPFVAKAAAEQSIDAVICIGCIIQGETRHFEFIAQAVAHGVMQAGLDTGKPIIFGVLTTDNAQQAADRAGGKHGNKGIEAAVACLKQLHTITLLNELNG
jgi:6,7-dimethyl-8-ribityllumazine synthase